MPKVGDLVKKYKKDILSNRSQFHLAIFLVIMAILLNYFSGLFVGVKGTATPPDLILDNIPPIDLSFIYLLFFFLVIILFFYYPLKHDTKNFSYFICMFSLFIIIRAGFVILTHLKTPDDAVPISVGKFFYDALVFPNKMFFASQVGIPFLGFLIIKCKNVRNFMLFSSVILSIVLLFMHQHYSIDVLAAYFITYGIYRIGKSIFKYKDGEKK